MSKHADKKTNAMRELDRVKQPYEAHWFDCPEAMSGVEVAHMLGEDPDRVFKTLVTVGKSGDHYVFMIPVALELDLKKAAIVVGEKAIAMVERTSWSYRLCPWWMFAIGYEKVLYYHH